MIRSIPKTEYYAPSDALKRYNIKVGDLYYRFGFAGGAYGLTSIDAAKMMISTVSDALSPQHRYVTAGAQVIEYFTYNVTLKVINAGPLFTAEIGAHRLQCRQCRLFGRHY